MRRARRAEERGSRSSLGGGRFNKTGNSQTRLGGGSRKTRRSPRPPARIFKVYIEALTGFSHICHPDSLINTLFSQDYVLGTATTVGKVSRTYIPRMREGVRSLQLPGSISGVNQWSHPLDDLL